MANETVARISGVITPLDVLVRISSYLSAPIDLQSFSRTCSAARQSVSVVREQREFRRVRDLFTLNDVTITQEMYDKARAVHPITSRGAIVITDESADPSRGLELAWIEGDSLIQAPLGLVGHQGLNTPAASVQSVKLTPDENFIGMVVVLRRAVPPAGADAVERLRGMNLWKGGSGDYVRRNYEFHPGSDCTVQIVELVRNKDGTPDRLELYTLSHRFVPEFGFDFVWVDGSAARYALAFASIVHTQNGAMLLSGTWRDYRRSGAFEDLVLQHIMGAQHVFQRDRRNAICDFERSVVTSYIKLSADARMVFFDTSSRCGVFRNGHQPNIAFGLQNCSLFHPDCALEEQNVMSGDTFTLARMLNIARTMQMPPRVMSRIMAERFSLRAHRWSGTACMNMVSPDGTMLCTLRSTLRLCDTEERLYVSMFDIGKGALMYQISLHDEHRELIPAMLRRCVQFPFDRSSATAHRVMGFSTNSDILWVKEVMLTANACVITNALPFVIDARSGLTLQRFGNVRHPSYDGVQVAPDGRTVYATRIMKDRFVVDALDVLTGRVLKTVCIEDVEPAPYGVTRFIQAYVAPHKLRMVVTGGMDLFEEATRTWTGCRWRLIDLKKTWREKNSAAVNNMNEICTAVESASMKDLVRAPDDNRLSDAMNNGNTN